MRIDILSLPCTGCNSLGQCFVILILEIWRFSVFSDIIPPLMIQFYLPYFTFFQLYLQCVLTSKNYQNREVAEYVENCYSCSSLAVIRVFMNKVLQGFETLGLSLVVQSRLQIRPHCCCSIISKAVVSFFLEAKKNSVCGSQQLGNIGFSMNESLEMCTKTQSLIFAFEEQKRVSGKYVYIVANSIFVP